MTFAVSQSITTLCRCCVTVLEQCFAVTACIFATWLGARCVCELFRRARWRRPRTMPFPTEFPAAPYITREVDSEGRLISRMKQYDENNPSPRNLRERYRDHTSRRRERASGTVSCLYSRRATFGQAMVMVALVVSAVALCASTVSATVPVNDDGSSLLVYTLASRVLQTTAITDASIKAAADECKAESSDYNCQATHGPISTWDTSSVTTMQSSTCMAVVTHAQCSGLRGLRLRSRCRARIAIGKRLAGVWLADTLGRVCVFVWCVRQ